MHLEPAEYSIVDLTFDNGNLATIESVKESKKCDHTNDLDLSSESEHESKDKAKLNASLVEILRDMDLKAVQEEIKIGFRGQPKEPFPSNKARQISKIRAKIQMKKYLS